MNHYDVLGLQKDASQNDIEQAYRKLRIKWHPDKHDESAKAHATVRFVAIRNAFEILSDANKKAFYDAELHRTKGGNTASSSSSSSSASTPVSSSGMHELFAKCASVFQNVFQEASRESKAAFAASLRGFTANILQQRTESVARHECLTLNEFHNGCTRTITLPTVERCSVCAAAASPVVEHGCVSGFIVNRESTFTYVIEPGLLPGQRIAMNASQNIMFLAKVTIEIRETVENDACDTVRYRRLSEDGYDVQMSVPLIYEGKSVSLAYQPATIVNISIDSLTHIGLGLRKGEDENAGTGDLYIIFRC